MARAQLDTDVLVVGGGPIGLAAAIEARLAGLRVMVLESRTGEIDKACGEGLMPGAVAALERLGVHPAGIPFEGIRYCGRAIAVEHRFRSGTGLGVRRTTLHAALSGRAAELGVERRIARVKAISQDAETVAAGGIQARWLLGCDGLHSATRDLAGLAITGPRSRSHRFGLRQHFQIAPWSEFVEVYWGPHAEVYITPVAPQLVGIAVLGPRGTSYVSALDEVPAIRQRLAGGKPAGPVMGAGPLLQRTRARVAGRVLLVGDASGYVDAITGEGIRVGLEQARAAIQAVRHETPHAYERSWASATRDYRVLTHGLVRAANHRTLRPLIVPAAHRVPAVFGQIVERLAR